MRDFIIFDIDRYGNIDVNMKTDRQIFPSSVH